MAEKLKPGPSVARHMQPQQLPCQQLLEQCLKRVQTWIACIHSTLTEKQQNKDTFSGHNLESPKLWDLFAKPGLAFVHLPV